MIDSLLTSPSKATQGCLVIELLILNHGQVARTKHNPHPTPQASTPLKRKDFEPQNSLYLAGLSGTRAQTYESTTPVTIDDRN
ncbi:hypothetical protein TNCV_1864431 [Trichonephila clavipes]|nr:hypothetical protein TNCV_1864431 [Trichonephila clavipes]